jgi:uncharacterized protein (DUF1499 family)
VAETSRVANLAAKLGALAALAFALGPALAQLGLASPFVAFRVFTLGVLLGLVALVLGAAGLWATRGAAGRGGRPRALFGAGVGAAIVGTVVAVVLAAGAGPVINDISTDVEDPPRFRAAQTEAANEGRDLAYPGAAFARAQREGYPDLEPIRVAGEPDAVYRRCLAAAAELGWKITMQDAATRSFEAEDVSRIFRFVDDIAVRVRASGDGAAVVDVRSKSRVGKGDLGANAARIRAFRTAVAG